MEYFAERQDSGEPTPHAWALVGSRPSHLRVMPVQGQETQRLARLKSSQEGQASSSLPTLTAGRPCGETPGPGGLFRLCSPDLDSRLLWPHWLQERRPGPELGSPPLPPPLDGPFSSQFVSTHVGAHQAPLPCGPPSIVSAPVWSVRQTPTSLRSPASKASPSQPCW